MIPLVIAVTGASALQLAERSLQLLLENGHFIILILSKGAYKVWSAEQSINIPINPLKQEEFWRNRLGTSKGQLICLRWNDLAANVASGSYKTKGMVVIPSTMGTIGRINSGISLDLIERVADVHLKEKRPLILVPREMPFNLIHLKNLTQVTEAGALIVPPIPAWYTNPANLDEMVDFIVARIFDSLKIELISISRWEGGTQ